MDMHSFDHPYTYAGRGRGRNRKFSIFDGMTNYCGSVKTEVEAKESIAKLNACGKSETLELARLETTMPVLAL